MKNGAFQQTAANRSGITRAHPVFIYRNSGSVTNCLKWLVPHQCNMSLAGAEERQREIQLRRAIGNRLSRGERRLDAADLADELNASEWTVEYLLERACRVRGLDVVEEIERGRKVWVVV